MDVTAIGQLSTSMAETGTKEAVGMAVLKKAQDAEKTMASGLIAALPAPVASTPNLPAHLGNTINTTA
jgi:hypothetical protein